MKFTTYLAFENTCEQAFQFYEKALGGKIVFTMRWKEAGDGFNDFPEEYADKIMHMQLAVGDAILMGADSPPNCPHRNPMGGFSIHIHADSPEEADRLYNNLSEGGQIFMPIAETDWAYRFGVIADKFGTPWMINCEKPMPANP